MPHSQIADNPGHGEEETQNTDNHNLKKIMVLYTASSSVTLTKGRNMLMSLYIS